MKKVNAISESYFEEEYMVGTHNKLMRFSIYQSEVKMQMYDGDSTTYLSIPIEVFQTMISNSQEVLDYYKLRKKLEGGKGKSLHSENWGIMRKQEKKR